MDSILIWHKGKMLYETYGWCYSHDTLHRMYSITKSYTALAVCALAAEHRINLNDPIVSYFPDYVPDDAHPYLLNITIQDLLDMKTCYKSTTYKDDLNSNWVKSFFTTSPDHRSGQIFKYDTSAAHTLAALVKRICGIGVLDYLRQVYLDLLGFSKEAYILKDPFGDEIGGSGLVALPSDLMTTAKFLLSVYNEDWRESCSFLFHDQYDAEFFVTYTKLIRQCLTLRSETLHEGKTLDECQGYGSQFWMIRNGFMMYGMGGQYAAIFPEENLIIVTTADAQSVQGGTQIILDEIHRIDEEFRVEGSPDYSTCYPHRPVGVYDTKLLKQALNPICGTYEFPDHRQGFLSCTISQSEFLLEHQNGTFQFPISYFSVKTTDPNYQQSLDIKVSGLRDGCLYVFARIYGENVGSIRIMIKGDGKHITVYMRKIAEFLYAEFDGFLEGILID